jgi:tetratricopeptide (TPR) repeat protein
MTESEAMALLRSQLEETHPEPEMKLLAETLGFVPLAISQAAANISRRSLPISDYLEELRKGDESLASFLDESLPQLRRDSGRTNSIVATWKVTFEYVRKTAPPAARLLSLICFFDCQDIPQALLEGQYGEEVSMASQTRRKAWWKRRMRVKRKKPELLPVSSLASNFEEDWLTLRDFSLIKLNRNRKNFSMHPMVQFTTLRWLVLQKERDAWSQHFTSLMNDKFPDPGFSEPKVCEQLIAHALAAVPYRPVDAATRPLQTWAELTLKVADYYQKSIYTPWDFVQKLYGAVAQAFEITLGKTAPESLKVNNKRCSILSLLDRHNDAEKLYRRAMHLQIESLGPAHPDTLAIMDYVGGTLAAQGRASEADEIFLQALNTRLRTLGPRHEITQEAFDARGTYLLHKGRYREAYDIWRLAYEARVQVAVGNFNATWAGQLNHLGLSELMRGNTKEAAKYLREALSEREKGPVDTDYMELLSSLAGTLAAQGDYIGAAPLYSRVYEWYGKGTSCECKDKLLIMDLARVLSELDDRLDDAEHVARQGLVAWLEHDDVDPDVAPDVIFAIAHILGNVLEKKGRYEEALDLYKRAYDGAKGSVGEQHDDTIEYKLSYDKLLEKIEEKEAEEIRDEHDRAIPDAGQSAQDEVDARTGAEHDTTRSSPVQNGEDVVIEENLG